MKFEEVRKQYGSDEEMARAIFMELQIARCATVLQMSQRQRAEQQLKRYLNAVLPKSRSTYQQP